MVITDDGPPEVLSPRRLARARKYHSGSAVERNYQAVNARSGPAAISLSVSNQSRYDYEFRD